MSCECNSGNGETLVFTCAGAAYSGQVANNAGVKLAREKAGALFCAAAVAAEIPAKLARTQKAGRRVVIDGCEDHCARIILEKAGVKVDTHVVVTEQGIKKMPPEPQMETDVARIADVTREMA